MKIGTKTAFTPEPPRHNGAFGWSVSWRGPDGCYFQSAMPNEQIAQQCSAAPAMYEALKDAWNTLTEFSDVRSETRAGWALQKIEKALDQAEGRQL